MKKIEAVMLVLILLMSIGIVSGKEVVINSSITNPVIQVKNLYAESNISISTQLNISKEPQIVAYIQNSQETISVSGNISTSGVNVIPMQLNIISAKITASLQVPLESNISYPSGNITLKSQSIELNLEKGSTITIKNQSLRLVQVTAPNETYEIKNIDLSNKSEALIIQTQVVFNKTELHNVSISIGNGTTKSVLNSNGVVVNTTLTLELDSAGIYVRTGDIKTELKNLPDTVAVIANNNSNKNIELKLIQQEPVYEIKETRYGKILGIFPASMDVVIQVSANNSETKSIKEPWWSVFFVQ